MKKFYAFAAAAVAALSMNAEPLYIVGSGILQGEEAVTLDWTPATPAEVNPNGEGNYEFDVNDCVAIKISTAGAYFAEITEENLGTAVALELNPEAGNIQSPWKGNYHFVVAGDLSTITVTTDTPKPEGFTKV